MNALKSPDRERSGPILPASTNNPYILVDAHVHIYDCFAIDKLLDAAWNNFHRAASQVGQGNCFIGVLLLTESGQHQWFQQILSGIEQSHSTTWSFSKTAEPCSLQVHNTEGRTLYLIAGRQVVTAEKLEVLALICDRTFDDGLSTADTIQAIQTAGGIAALPWGVGKWIGQRGKLVAQLMQQQNLQPIFLGDNSGRPKFWARPHYFKQSEQRGNPILLGTDPLPLAKEADRPGKFGLMMEGELDCSKPGAALKTYLLDQAANWQPYGDLETPWGFMQNQTALRLTHYKPMEAPAETDTVNGFPETADIETSSDDYATRFAGAIGAWLLEMQKRATLKLLAAYPQAKVLDVGGGHGQLTKALIDAGYNVTVLGSAEVCRARIQTYVDQGQCQFQVGNVLAMPYADNAFDIVISYRFLAHVTHWQKFLQELARVASQAVMVDYSTVRSANAIAPALFKFKKGLEGNTRPFICYQEQEITTFYQSLGWQQKQRYAQFFWPMVLHRTLGKPHISSGLEAVPRAMGLTRLFGSPVIAKFEKS